MCDYGNMSYNDYVWPTSPVARKHHTCCECGSAIVPKEKYEVVKGVWDGEFSTFKTCSFCANVRAHARYDFDLNSDEGFPFGQLWECVGFDYVVD